MKKPRGNLMREDVPSKPQLETQRENELRSLRKEVPPTAGAKGLGLIQIIDVTTSLDSGSVKPVGVPYSSGRDFGLSGGMTGIPGSSTLFTAGGAFFDTFQPFQPEFGLASLSPTRRANPADNNAS